MITRFAGFDPSINTFFNALIREAGLAQYRASHKDARHGCFVFHNGLNREQLLVPCLYRSSAGRHTLGSHLVMEHAGQATPMDFSAAVAWCLKLPELQTGSSATSRQRFLNLALESHRNLVHLKARQRGRSAVSPEAPRPFIEAEQALVHGHPGHPLAKDRGSMTIGEALCFAPEFGATFALAWYSVDRRQLQCTRAGGSSPGALTASLYAPAGRTTLAAHPPGHILLPCHPLQHRHWQASPAIRRLQARGLIRFLGMGPAEWQATSSPQTLWSPNQEWMIRFSLSVRLQGRQRHISEQEAVRGATLTRALERGPFRRWLGQHPHFTILREPAALALCDETGEALEASRMVLRDNPFRGRQARNQEMLATLLQEAPGYGQSRLAMALARHGIQARHWFQRFLDQVVDPLLEAQTGFGILLGAHPQNLVLGLDEHFLPQQVCYRGGQDSQCLPPARDGRRLSRHQQADEDEAIRLFCHDLFVDTVFNTIASLARADLCSEGELLKLLKDWLNLRRAAVHRDSRAMDYLLASPCLFARSTFLANLHDAQAPGLLASNGPRCYPFPNPLATASSHWSNLSLAGALEGMRRATA